MELPWLSPCENSPCCLFLCQLKILNLGAIQIAQQAAHKWVNPIVSRAGNGSGKALWFYVYWQIYFTHWVSAHLSNEIQWFCLALWQGSEIKAGLHYAMALSNVQDFKITVSLSEIVVCVTIVSEFPAFWWPVLELRTCYICNEGKIIS